MKEIVIERKTVAFSVDGEVYELPLAQSLPVSQSRKIVEIEASKKDRDTKIYLFLVDLLDEYCPGVTSKIDNDGLQAIYELWANTTKEDTGLGVGESQASE